jgi:hypothetical protein
MGSSEKTFEKFQKIQNIGLPLCLAPEGGLTLTGGRVRSPSKANKVKKNNRALFVLLRDQICTQSRNLWVEAT